MLIAAVGGDVAALAEEDDLVASVPRFDHVEALVDLALQLAITQVPGDSVESDLSRVQPLPWLTPTIGRSVAVAATPISRGVVPAGVDIDQPFQQLVERSLRSSADVEQFMASGSTGPCRESGRGPWCIEPRRVGTCP
ncbi:hypothetical protein GCM10023317_89990 [Actinopolymorpha pittospori]